jgi:hypothetical protein
MAHNTDGWIQKPSEKSGPIEGIKKYLTPMNCHFLPFRADPSPEVKYNVWLHSKRTQAENELLI